MKDIGVKLIRKIKSMDWRVLLLDVLLVIAALLLAGQLLEFVDTLYYEQKLYENESSFIYRLRDEEYPQIVADAALNRAEKKSGYDSEHMQEYYAVGDYYEAASLYKAYLTTGDEEHAARMKERMQEAETAMGELVTEVSKIQAQLGIEE